MGIPALRRIAVGAGFRLDGAKQPVAGRPVVRDMNFSDRILILCR